MTHFVWSSEYELGIDVIDLQHQRIVDYINRIYTIVDAGSDDAELSEILTHLVDYTFSHLAFEEAMLEEIGYGDFHAHQLGHRAFSQLIEKLQQRADNGENVGRELATFLQDWLITHIMVEDAKYVDAVSASLLGKQAGARRQWLREAVSKYFQ